MQSCRDVLTGLQGGSNASLLMARYLKAAMDGSQDAIDARAELFRRMKTAAAAAYPIYAQAFRMRQETLNGLSAARTFETLAPMIVGLGSSNVLETGLTLNPLYGAPMIPGASIKGVVAHYCSKVLGVNEGYRGPVLDDRNRPTQKAGEIYEALFGKVDRTYNADGTLSPVPPDEMSGGYLRFYDAWIEPDSLEGAFVNDVMTPHHGDYYGDKADLPTDFDDPNPVTFMTVQGRFEVRVGCEEPDPDKRKEWLRFALDLTERALTAWGAGGKIRAGYGRLRVVESEEEKKLKAAQKQADQRQKDGWLHKEGETMSLTCIEWDKKHQKSRFQTDDGKPFQWQGKAPTVEKGGSVTVRIVKIGLVDRSNEGYFIEPVN